MSLLYFLMENDVGKLIIAIVCAVLIVGAGSAFCLIFMGHRHIARQVTEISKKYASLHDLLTIQLQNELKKIYSIAQENVEYEAVYNMNNDLYQEVLRQEDLSAQEAVNDLNKLLMEKKYKLIKENFDHVKLKVQTLEDQYKKLDDSIGEIINIDEENRQGLLIYRREFREVKEEYEAHKNELKFIEPSFIAVFEKLEEYLIESEKLVSSAHYVESKEKFPEIEKVLKALKKSIGVLPKLVTLSFIVLPSQIEELTERYHSMVDQGYPLHHLKFQTTVDSFGRSLETIHHRLEQFQTRNVEFELNQIRDSLMAIGADLDHEVESKQYFSDHYDEIYNGSYKLENKFIHLRRSIPDYKMTYQLRDSSVTEIEKIQNGINELGMIKRTLDTYVHSSSQQPYSALSKRLMELSDAMNRIESSIEEVQKYLLSLKHDTDDGYSFITETYLQLKRCESTVRKIGVPSVTTMLRNAFNQCYEYLQRAGDIILKLPINVDELNDNLREAKSAFSELCAQIEPLPGTVKQAEEAIVYANQYRQEFYDVKTTLLRAEKSFAEGDFIRTSDETITMIKKIRPEAGK